MWCAGWSAECAVSDSSVENRRWTGQLGDRCSREEEEEEEGEEGEGGERRRWTWWWWRW